MMRKLFLFLMILLISIIPLAAAAHGTTKSVTAQINTKLTAGTAKGTFVGFSSTSHDSDSGLTPITVLNLALDPQKPTEEIYTMTASGEFYAYWIVRNNTNAVTMKLSWVVDPSDLSIKVTKDSKEITSSSELARVDASSSTTDVTTGSQKISVLTENLLDKTYGSTYTIKFTINAEVQS